MTTKKIFWSDVMSVGVESLDNDHKILIQYLNDFVEACDNDEGILVTDPIFAGLMDYTDYHFSREEEIMERCGYPDLEAHKALHAELRIKLISIRENYLQSPTGALRDETKRFLQSWLQEHILLCDMDYAESVAGTGAGD